MSQKISISQDGRREGGSQINFVYLLRRANLSIEESIILTFVVQGDKRKASFLSISLLHTKTLSLIPKKFASLILNVTVM